MKYLVSKILELIEEKEPTQNSESIILINGFESLNQYCEFAEKICEHYSESIFSLNIKLAKRKWDTLSKLSDTTTIQQMQQNKWVADKESVTYYRNQHSVDILILLGTEDEEDTGGLLNCFTITPDWFISDLDGHYDRIVEQCFTEDLSNDDREIINTAYKMLFEYCPIDICKLSDIADEWTGQFDTINEFCEEYGKHLIRWGLPNRELKPLTPSKIKTKNNFLRDEKDFISGKMFQQMSPKAYKGLAPKFEEYEKEGEYSGDNVDYTSYGFTGYDDFTESVLEFARGENVQTNKARLLKVDFTIINDILKFKPKKPLPPVDKVSEKSITGEPIEIVLRTALYALKKAKDSQRNDLFGIHFDFTNALIVLPGYTDIDDAEKRELLADTWKNICVHVNGLFDFIDLNSWEYMGKQIKIVCDTPKFFDPLNVYNQIGNTVGTAPSNNTLNKIIFTVSLVDENGHILQEISENETKDMSNTYAWSFDDEATWLFDFKDIILDNSFSIQGAKNIPLGVMRRIKNTLVIKSEEEFFDIYDEDSVDLSYDLCQYVNSRVSSLNDNDLNLLSILFSDLGEIFCRFVNKLTTLGFYNVLCSDLLSDLNEKYMAVADKILSTKFDEDKQWIIDAFLQSFVIQDRANYIDDDTEPVCIIIPPWHPAALQKIAAQKRFIIDGVTQKISEYDNHKGIPSIDTLIDHFIHMTEIQSSIDLFPADGNDYMGVIGTYGHFCVYGNEHKISSIKTRMKDVIHKEAIYDEEFKASELTRMNDDAQMIYDVLLDYNKAMPSVKCALSIVFINPPDLQPIIAAISKYTKDIHAEDPNAVINLKLSILVRPENKGGKNYLTYWMNDYFSEEKDTSVRIYMNEWSKKSELERLLSDNNDIVFNMDLLHAEVFKFIVNPGEMGGKVSDCRFPIVYKPSPLSLTSKKRKIEITQTQFSTSFKHTQIVRYKKNSETLPKDTYLAVRETSVENETKQIIDMLHTKAYWVVCIDKVMDGALLRTDNAESTYSIIGFSTGKGMYGQYNLTITARNSILETVKNRLRERLSLLFKWKPEIINSAVRKVIDEASVLDGISMLSAINQKGTNINEFMAYVMTSLREKQYEPDSALKVIIHLDSYKHWFDNSDKEECSMRPDFLMLSVKPPAEKENKNIRIKAVVIECKTATYKNYIAHMEKAKKQVQHGLTQLGKLFDPNADSIERRYWYAQLYRALVFAQVTFTDSSDQFTVLSAQLRSILDGNFEIEWEGKILGYWVDLKDDNESTIIEDGITICKIPQKCIQDILTGTHGATYIDVDAEVLDEMDNISIEDKEKNEELELRNKKREIINRRKKTFDSLPKKEQESVLEREDTEPKVDVSEKEPDNIPFAPLEKGPDNNETEPLTSIQSVTALNDLRVLIGRDRSGYEVYWEFGNKGLSNRHLLITGTSGQGKTYAIQSMLYEVSKSNVSMVVFDYTEGFRTDQLEKKFLDKMDGHIDNQVVYFTGVPINPFARHEIEVAGMKAPEKISDVAQRIASTLSHVYKFGDQQFAAIYDASYSGLSKYGDNMSMKYLESELNASQNKYAKTVVSKMTPFLHSVDFSNDHCDWNDILYSETNKLTIFQLTSFVRDIQVIITEFMLWDMWHYTKKHGNKDKPFVVVLDEAQNLSHADNSPSGLILTEGRKFGWSTWYATQSLRVLNDDEVTRLLQSAFKMYFKPTDDEIISMAKQLNPSDANEWRSPLTNLKKGECIVVGDRIQKDGVFKSGRPTVTKVTSFEERA